MTPPVDDDAAQLGSDRLDALFAPHALAVVGASDDPGKYGNWLAVQALRGSRPVHLVNRARATVLGRPAYESVRAIGSPVDLVVVAVPAAGFEEAVDDALAAGARAIVGISAGLAETGDAGRRTQERVTAKVRAAGARLLGPNCLGLLDHGSGLHLAPGEFPVGSIGLISQSGNLALELALLLDEHDLGVSRFVSLGNQADLVAADLLRAYVEDEGTRAIALYCEDFRDGRSLARAAVLAAEAGKPVVLLTVGGSAASVRTARSHTGALASPRLVVEAACRAAGMELVATPAQLAHLLQALLRSRPPRGSRVAVLADGGGHASVAADRAGLDRLEVPEFSGGLQRMVAAELPPTASVGNPVDVAGGGEQDVSCFPRVVQHLMRSDEVDAVLMTGFFGGYEDYGPDLAARELTAACALGDAARAGVLVVQTMNWRRPAAAVLRAGGVPVYRGIEEATWVLGRLAGRRTDRPAGVPALPEPAAMSTGSGYFAARALLAQAGVPFVRAVEVSAREDVVTAAAGLRPPFVLKALGAEHKSDGAGVVLGLPDLPALLSAWEDLQQRLGGQPCSVEEMLPTADAVEILVGVRHDPRFGPVVLVGLGGVLAEVLSDVGAALGPVSLPEAERLLLSLRGAPLLTGVRGRPPVDVRAAARVVVAVSECAARHPELAEVECNPVAVTPDGAVALDARIVLREP